MQPNEPLLTATPVSPVLARSMEAFYRNLAELLTLHYGKWVAYHEDEFLGCGRSETELYQQCLRRGFKDDEFVVLYADNQARYDHSEVALAWIETKGEMAKGLNRRVFFACGIAAVVLAAITAAAATAVKLALNALSDDFKAYGETVSWTLAESRERNVLVNELAADPAELVVPGGRIRFKDAWVERRCLSTHKYVWFPVERPVGGYRLHFTLADGNALIKPGGLGFVEDDRVDRTIGGQSTSDGQYLYLVWLEKPDVSELRLSLIRSFGEPRAKNIRFFPKPVR